MDEIDKAKNKDKILKFILTEPNGMNNTHIARKLFNNKVGASEVKKLIYAIADHDKFLIDIEERRDGIVVKANDLTKKFVSNNSFEKLYFRNAASGFMKATEKNERLKSEEQFLDLQKENLQLTNKLNRQKIKTHWVPIIISIFGLLIAIASYFKPQQERDNNDQLKVMQERINYLEGILVKENDSLRLEVAKREESKDTLN